MVYFPWEAFFSSHSAFLGLLCRQCCLPSSWWGCSQIPAWLQQQQKSWEWAKDWCGAVCRVSRALGASLQRSSLCDVQAPAHGNKNSAVLTHLAQHTINCCTCSQLWLQDSDCVGLDWKGKSFNAASVQQEPCVVFVSLHLGDTLESRLGLHFSHLGAVADEQNQTHSSSSCLLLPFPGSSRRRDESQVLPAFSFLQFVVFTDWGLALLSGITDQATKGILFW